MLTDLRCLFWLLLTSSLIRVSIVEHRSCQLVNLNENLLSTFDVSDVIAATDLRVGELHAVLIHTSSHYVLELLVLDQTVTVQIVDFEQEFYFVFRRLTRKLMHCVDELVQCDCPRVILVEDLEDSLVEERLKQKAISLTCNLRGSRNVLHFSK